MASTKFDPNAADDGNTLIFGSLVLHLRGFSASVDGRFIPLTHTEFLLLVTLARDPYSVLDRQTLASVVADSNAGHRLAGSSARAVDTHIARLRKKLAGAGCDCIHTMRHVGYRFVPPQDTSSD